MRRVPLLLITGVCAVLGAAILYADDKEPPAGIVVDKDKLGRIEIVPVHTIFQVLQEALEWKGKGEILSRIQRMD